jgi:hypothetical protein
LLSGTAAWVSCCRWPTVPSGSGPSSQGCRGGTERWPG